MAGRSLIPVERIENAILLIRDQKVMLDRELAVPRTQTRPNRLSYGLTLGSRDSAPSINNADEPPRETPVPTTQPTRRHFLQYLGALAAGAGAADGILDSIARAAAIQPARGSEFLDAEHVVILMQENRSFDHAFGTLRGVRGFNDPRAIRLPDGYPVWAQTNTAGETYLPFRLDIRKTKSTWMGCLPHGWADQVDAANGGKHDRWLIVKPSGKKEYAKMPLTLGHYTRADIPFYYALADAFTICDQHFCSTLTGTTPNRLHLMTGTSRERPAPDVPALVRNEDCDYGSWVHWTTFPERLQDAGISWKIYQNELGLPTGQSDEEQAWTSNFGCNPIEWFTQFHVRFAESYRRHLESRIRAIPKEIDSLRKEADAKPTDADKIRRRIDSLTSTRERHQKDLAQFSPEKFAKLSPRDKELYERAFCTNAADADYRQLAQLRYRDGEATRTVVVPKGDVLYQFRHDVNHGGLPTVSWLIPPENFSDHPCTAWYGQWFLSEVLNILTKNPDVWRKTIFILTYDENDGYFDHVPPFQAPHPAKPDSGLASAGIDTTLDYLELAVDRKHKPRGAVRGNSLGLGFRVPMIIASPWTRGGCVCSQVFDHTSVLRFLETFLTHKVGRPIVEPNITRWRRTICGDLTSAFQAAADAQVGLTQFVDRDQLIESIHKAQFEKVPTDFRALSADEVRRMRESSTDPLLPRQEPGVRKSCPLPYELEVNGEVEPDRRRFTMHLVAKSDRFGDKSAGAPFIAYAMTAKGMNVRHYAVAPVGRLHDSWPIDDFADGRYHVRLHGPNGFFREFIGSLSDTHLRIHLASRQSSSGTTGVLIQAENRDRTPCELTVKDLSYGHPLIRDTIAPGRTAEIVVETADSRGWYDLSIHAARSQLAWRYAGRLETGAWSISDPIMGRS
jgi:phospholipase C